MRAIEQTLKVTKAMKLISTAKLRTGRRMLEDTDPYFKRIQNSCPQKYSMPSPL
jgi:F-type H+-transporting ATPase subunit gamma